MSDPRFSIRRDGTTIKLSVYVPAVGEAFVFERSFGTEWATILLVNAIHDVLRNAMSLIREEAYNQGWRDAKSKQTKKRVHFDSRLP